MAFTKAKRQEMHTPSIQKNLSTNIEQKSTPHKAAPLSMIDQSLTLIKPSPKRSENYDSDQEEVKSHEF